jgi:tRNA-dependent cyclodipeptide synthase
MNYKVTFTKLNKEILEISPGHALLTISVGQRPHEGKRFAATLRSINDTFKKCTIAVCDTLQRHSLSIISNSLTAENLYEVTKKEGDQWIERNEEIIEDIMDIDCNIKRWDEWLFHDKYQILRQEVNELYKNDNGFYSIINSLADDFTKRLFSRGYNLDEKNSITKCTEYLLEECAAMSIWYDEGYDFEIYPSVRNKAIEYAFSKIRTDLYNKKLFGIGLNFKKVENIYETSKIALQQIINLLPGHVYWKDTKGKFLGCNTYQAESYNLKSPQELIGKYDSQVVKKDLAKAIIDNDRDIINKKEHVIIEEQTYINREKKWVLSHKAPLVYKDEILGVVGISVDITKQKKMEQKLLKQTKILSDALIENKRFFNNLSHEIRTPLHIISSITEELFTNIDYLSKEEIRTFLESLLSNNKRLLNLLSDLLEIAKNTQKKSNYNYKTLNIVDTVRKSKDELYKIANIEFTSPSDKIEVLYDDIKLSQVMRNLIDNAVKYQTEDLVVIKIIDNKNDVIISVQNKSPFIAEEELEKMFEPFYQCDHNRSSSGHTGLGLSIVKEIILANKGSVWSEYKNETLSVNIKLPKL